MAVLGSLAYSALQRASQPVTANMATAGTGGAPVSQVISGASEDVQGTATLLLRAMISAAKADGQIDQGEMDRILGKLSEAGSEPEARDFVLSEMRGPLDLDRLVAEVKTPQQAAQVYAASLLAIDVDTLAEKAYLGRLAQALSLPPQVTGHIHDLSGCRPEPQIRLRPRSRRKGRRTLKELVCLSPPHLQFPMKRSPFATSIAES